MNPLIGLFRRVTSRVSPLPPGIYHYQAPPQDPRNYRLHLRIEPDGKGVMIVNASTILHLNQIATEFAYHLIRSTPEEKAIREITTRYRVNKKQAQQDYRDFVERITSLVTTQDLDPVMYLDFDLKAPHDEEVSAPYRLDCAITYRLPQTEDLKSAPQERVSRELTTEEWFRILDKAWQAGIPHILFTGGEPTLRDDLVELINHAEKNGQVSGLLTNGYRLADQDYLNTLLQTGLDHLLIVLETQETPAWKGLRNALESDIFTAVHLTLTPDNLPDFIPCIERLSDLKVSAISLSASSHEFDEPLLSAREYIARLNIPLIWDLPVPYSSINPVSLETTSGEIASGAGKAWLYVEPDGDVLPSQGINTVLGNLLRDPWDSIWKSQRA